ncbi:MAG: thioredoxin family protein [Thermoleophilia bacterium]|nr:thioredoxin family protein [Thermoleophilia bacterium]
MNVNGLTIGDTAPALTLPGTDGADHEIGAADASEATVVYWTCNHCPYALAWEDRLHDVSRDYANRGVRVIAINSNDAESHPADSFEAMSGRVEREGGWPHPYLHDESQAGARAFGAKATPDVFVFDRDLHLRYRGAPDADYGDSGENAAWLRAALDAVLEGRDPDPAETEPVGCGVKWK